jgi:hypothetical protein
MADDFGKLILYNVWSIKYGWISAGPECIEAVVLPETWQRHSSGETVDPDESGVQALARIAIGWE